MTFAERMIVKANKMVFNKARKHGNLDVVIREAIKENTEVHIQYLLDNEIVSKEELDNALN